MDNKNIPENFVKISPIPDSKSTRFDYSFRTFFKKEGNLISCIIPAFDISFTVTEGEDRNAVGIAMVNSFIDYWAINYGLMRFAIELKKLGFKTEHERCY